jgi:L-arabinokinase
VTDLFETLGQGLFGPGPVIAASAPGRLDVMGGIADYSGSLVLQLPLTPVCRVIAQVGATDRVRIRSRRERGGTAFEAPLADVLDRPGEVFCDEARWAGYVAGCLPLLHRERPVTVGVDLLVDSAVPEGKGVSSSAALEVASLRALGALLGRELEPRELALLSQRVENEIVGAACGVMDQIAVTLGRADELLALRCQPAELLPAVPIPAGLAFFGIDSGVRHAVSGAEYTAVRTGAFMGYRMIAARAGRAAVVEGPGRVRIEDPVWNGYLARIPLELFRREFEAELPVRMSGREFLARFQGITDRVTRVDPDRVYAVRQPTLHPIAEHDRIGRFADLLRGDLSESERDRLGEWMFASHASYTACGLGSEATDRIVAAVRFRRGEGLYGAKVSGGGCGGTVVVLGRSDALPAVGAIAREYAAASGLPAQIFSGSSPGAAFRTIERFNWPAAP